MRYHNLYGGEIIIHENMLARHSELSEHISTLQEQLKSYPEGKLICAKNGTRCKWYCSDGKKQIYIPKKDRHFAEKLAAKKYLSSQLQDFLQEKKAIEFYLRHHSSVQDTAANRLLETPEYAELLSPYFKSFRQTLQDWVNSPYDSNKKNPEHLIHKTISGHCVRSKSEALIDFGLYTHHIPFRYECALVLGSIIIYPDFTIRHPRTGNLIYWEHFGMMDHPEYSSKVGSKLQLYISNGILPSIQLITTFETQKSPLTSEKVERIIEEYFS